MKKQKMMLVLALVGVVILGTVAGSLAYLFNNAGSRDNVFVGSEGIRAELSEPNWNAEDALEFVPGKNVKKDPMITNLSKDSKEYAAIRISFCYDDKTPMSQADVNRLVNLLKMDWNVGNAATQWSLADGIYQVGSGGKLTVSPEIIFVYNKTLNPGEITEPIFQSIDMKTGADGLTEADLRWLQKMDIRNGEIYYDLQNGLGGFYIIADGAAVDAAVYSTAEQAKTALINLFSDH